MSIFFQLRSRHLANELSLSLEEVAIRFDGPYRNPNAADASTPGYEINQELKKGTDEVQHMEGENDAKNL